jgi:hypothetical protein
MLGAATIVFKRKHHTAPGKQKTVSKSRHPAQQFSFGKTFCPLQIFIPLIYNVLKIFLENFTQERKL